MAAVEAAPSENGRRRPYPCYLPSRKGSMDRERPRLGPGLREYTPALRPHQGVSEGGRSGVAPVHGRKFQIGIAAPAAVVQPQGGQRHAQAQARTWKRRFRAQAPRCRCARADRHRAFRIEVSTSSRVKPDPGRIVLRPPRSLTGGPRARHGGQRARPHRAGHRVRLPRPHHDRRDPRGRGRLRDRVGVGPADGVWPRLRPGDQPDQPREHRPGNLLHGSAERSPEEVRFDSEKVTSMDWRTHSTLTHMDAPERIDVVMVNGDPNPDRPDLLPYGAGRNLAPSGPRGHREHDLRRDSGPHAPVAAPARAGCWRSWGRRGCRSGESSVF